MGPASEGAGGPRGRSPPDLIRAQGRQCLGRLNGIAFNRRALAFAFFATFAFNRRDFYTSRSSRPLRSADGSSRLAGRTLQPAQDPTWHIRRNRHAAVAGLVGDDVAVAVGARDPLAIGRIVRIEAQRHAPDVERHL